MQAKTHHFERFFRGGQDFFDPQIVLSALNILSVSRIVVVAILNAYCPAKCV
jgi:hypothetical protein